MRFVFSIILIVFLINKGGANPQKKYVSAIVAFYNCENLFDTIRDYSVNDEEFTPKGNRNYTQKVYQDKLEKLARVIELLGTDKNPDGAAIIGLAEIENERVLKDLILHKRIQKRNYRYVHFNSKDPRGIDVALLYNPKYFFLLNKKAYPVLLSENNKGSFYTRDVLWVKGLVGGNDTFHFFVSHWPSRVGGEKASMPLRATAAQTVRAQIDMLFQQNKNAKIIFMGDLNDNPDDESLTLHLRAKDNPKLKENELYNPWTTLYKNGFGTLAYNDVWSLFDQIVFSKSLFNKEKGFFFYKNYIFNKPFLIEQSGKFAGYPKRSYVGNIYNGGYSDHLPVYIILLKSMH